MYNTTFVFILIFIYFISDYLEKTSALMVENITPETMKGSKVKILKAITEPFLHHIIQVKKHTKKRQQDVI